MQLRNGVYEGCGIAFDHARTDHHGQPQSLCRAVEGAFGMECGLRDADEAVRHPAQPTRATVSVCAFVLKRLRSRTIPTPATFLPAMLSARTSLCACQCGGIRALPTHSLKSLRIMSTCSLSISCSTTSAGYTRYCGSLRQ